MYASAAMSAQDATTVDFRNFIVFLLGRDPGTLKSDIVSKNIHNWFARIWDSQIEDSKIEIMETRRTSCADRKTAGPVCISIALICSLLPAPGIIIIIIIVIIIMLIILCNNT